jgi:hypothetical protein
LPIGKYFDHENEKTILDKTGKLVGAAAPAASAAPAAATDAPVATTSTTTTTESAKNPTPPIEDDGLGEVL